MEEWKGKDVAESCVIYCVIFCNREEVAMEIAMEEEVAPPSLVITSHVVGCCIGGTKRLTAGEEDQV